MVALLLGKNNKEITQKAIHKKEYGYILVEQMEKIHYLSIVVMAAWR